MRIEVRPEVCVGAGQCVLTAGRFFDQGEDDGLVVLRRTEPGPAETAEVREAADRCPAGAITLREP
ncbi:(4Fe-4S)-binding protein [Streptomyces sp. DSM 44915]|uniref:(4Fe-4S)-binding protein n=1 Tax=Streptomyces chisholmiae TaxID=3075540 RepID=A0ABU2JVJ5_9ACTN|nr:ferredoxin [Streptomyces sp. DSM 44915]MDT0269013.1 (4Fe-4S)-binding protein [Streptomyces sp. DSM 44915]